MILDDMEKLQKENEKRREEKREVLRMNGTIGLSIGKDLCVHVVNETIRSDTFSCCARHSHFVKRVK